MDYKQLFQKIRTLEPTICYLLSISNVTTSLETKLYQMENLIINIPNEMIESAYHWRNKLAKWWFMYAIILDDSVGDGTGMDLASYRLEQQFKLIRNTFQSSFDYSQLDSISNSAINDGF
ncbi:hypothetical protein BLOT_003459 [Blomia tropicalis]|nr:hypothetical protein BLOT_003459 [Blomia tropicalis]